MQSVPNNLQDTNSRSPLYSLSQFLHSYVPRLWLSFMNSFFGGTCLSQQSNRANTSRRIKASLEQERLSLQQTLNQTSPQHPSYNPFHTQIQALTTRINALGGGSPDDSTSKNKVKRFDANDPRYEPISAAGYRIALMSVPIEQVPSVVQSKDWGGHTGNGLFSRF